MKNLVKHYFFVLLLSLYSSVTWADLTGIRIGIDAGHGGIDTGAIANGILERDVNLTTALAAREFFEADGATVVMTRETNTSFSEAGSGRTELVARARFFNAHDVDYMISVHHNSAGSKANGVLTYIARGNCDKPSQSGRLAAAQVKRIRENNQLPAMGGGRGSSAPCRKKAGVFQYNAIVVAETNMPAVLDEISFITNPEEAQRLKDVKYLRSNGWAIYAALVDHIGGGRTPIPYTDGVLHMPQTVVLTQPKNKAVITDINTAVLKWDNPNTPALVQKMYLSLQQAINQDEVVTPVQYVGRCDGQLQVTELSEYSVRDCGIINYNQWYRWEIRTVFRNGTEKIARHFFKTDNDPDRLAEVDTFSCENVTGLPVSECESLVNLYKGTQGKQWKNTPQNKWLQSDTPCRWDNVRCERGHVSHLYLMDNKLQGTLTDLSGLTALRVLQLENNQLTGELPPHFLPKTLRVLNVANNLFSGHLPDLSPLTYLQVAHLQNNNLCGKIPAPLGLLDNLVNLYLDFNMLETNTGNAALWVWLDDLNPSWKRQHANKECPPLNSTFSSLGQSIATDFADDFMSTDAAFTGGVSINGGATYRRSYMGSLDSTDIRIHITPDTQHVGKFADIVVLAAIADPFAEKETPYTYYMLDEKGYPLLWDQDPAHLKALHPNITLAAQQTFILYQGNFAHPIALKITVQYRLADGTVVTHGDPLELIVK